MSAYFLGVDGGQSGTTAVIGDERGRIVGWATGGPCNHIAAPLAREKFLRVMRECISRAVQQAGLDARTPTFRAACFGMSGGSDDKSDLIREIVNADHLTVTHDAMIALAGAAGGEPGIVVISGTGSIAFGENERRETARAGGWGYVFGDEGSAFDIVRQALRAVLRDHEGWGARTALTPALLEASEAADAGEMLHLFYKPEWPRARLATVAKTVSRIAEEGDPVAAGVLHEAARQLAVLAAAVRSQLWGDGDSIHVYWAGGVFGSPILLERFRALVSLSENVVCGPPLHGPATGALLLACRAAGISVQPYRSV